MLFKDQFAEFGTFFGRPVGAIGGWGFGDLGEESGELIVALVEHVVGWFLDGGFDTMVDKVDFT